MEPPDTPGRFTGIDEEDSSWSADLARMGTSIRRWSGNAASIVQAEPAEVRNMGDRQEPIVESLRRDAVLLFGSEVLPVSEGAA